MFFHSSLRAAIQNATIEGSVSTTVMISLNTRRSPATASNAKRGTIEQSGRRPNVPSKTVFGARTPTSSQRMILTRFVFVRSAPAATSVPQTMAPSVACRTVFGALRRVRPNVRRNLRIGNRSGVSLLRARGPNARGMNPVIVRRLARTTLAVVGTVVLPAAKSMPTVPRVFAFAPTRFHISKYAASSYEIFTGRGVGLRLNQSLKSEWRKHAFGSHGETGPAGG